MKRLLLLIFVSAICAMAFPQKVTGDKSAICKILTKEHKCRVVVQDISKKYNETITTWGYRQGYTSTPLVAKRCCICIHYYVDKYNPQIEMFARFKMKSSFHKTKRII